MIKVSTTGMEVSLKTDLRFPIPGQQGHRDRIIQQISHEGIVVKLMERLMRDNAGNISYFIYELDYGKTYQGGCVSDQSGNIDISTPEKLYDYLMKEYSLENGSDNNAEE